MSFTTQQPKMKLIKLGLPLSFIHSGHFLKIIHKKI